MKVKDYLFVFVFLVSILLIASACEKASKLVGEQIKKTNFDKSFCDKIQNEELKIRCNIKIGIEEKDISVCNNIQYNKNKNQEETFKNICYFGIAKVTMDYSVCEKITEGDGRILCVESILKSNKDLSECSQLDIGVQPFCYYYLAISEQDLSLCDKANVRSYRFYCYVNVTVSQQNPSICNQQVDQGVKELCYKGVAIAKQDTSLCNNVKRDIDQYECYTSVATSKRDTSICDDIPTNIYKSVSDKDFCKISVAKAKQDLSLCDSVTKGPDEICKSDVGIAKKDASICKNIQNDYEREKCYKGVAISVLDSSLCENIKNSDSRDETCYKDIAKLKKDLAVCEKIQSQSYKDKCYAEVAISKKEVSICDNLQGYYKEECIVSAMPLGVDIPFFR